MKKVYDFIILGDGPSAVSVMDHYHKRNPSLNGLLIDIRSNEIGAYRKGVKVVNPIIPKLPNLKLKDISNYVEILSMSKISEILLKEEYNSTTAYLGNSSIGVRFCKNHEEYELLKSLPNLFDESGFSITKDTTAMVENLTGQSLNGNLILPYTEHQWNVLAYKKIISDRIPLNKTLVAENIQYCGHNSSGVELAATINGNIRTLICTKLISCLGTGNIRFEKKVVQYRENDESIFTFKILHYYKRVYPNKFFMPQELSSVIVPASGICITNELQSQQSVMYDTNAGFSATTEYDNDFLQDMLLNYRTNVSLNFPMISHHGFSDFICTMPVDPTSYRQNPQNHFRFIISKSSDPSITYLNLPYFSAIKMAINNLPDLNII